VWCWQVTTEGNMMYSTTCFLKLADVEWGAVSNHGRGLKSCLPKYLIVYVGSSQ
jgi:hypothetical protein